MTSLYDFGKFWPKFVFDAVDQLGMIVNAKVLDLILFSEIQDMNEESVRLLFSSCKDMRP